MYDNCRAGVATVEISVRISFPDLNAATWDDGNFIRWDDGTILFWE